MSVQALPAVTPRRAPETPIYTFVRPFMYPKQLAAIYDPARIVVIEASTKSGKTVGCMCWLLEQALAGHAGQQFWWIAPIFAQAKIAFRRLRRILPRWAYKKNESELTITLGNGAVIWFKGSENPDSLYGEDVQAAVIDEASRCKEEAFTAIRSTLTATRGPLRVIGNVKGRKNWAYKLGRRAAGGAAGMAYHRITANDAVAGGVLDAAEIDAAREDLPEAVFKELYEAAASDDEGNPFGASFIDACILDGLSTEPTVAAGWDLAKSRDWSVGIGLDQFGQVTWINRFQRNWLRTVDDVVELTAGVPALVDSTGVGDAVLEMIQSKAPDNFEGYTFGSRSKQQLMEGLAVGIQSKALGFPEGQIPDELREFEYVYTRTGVTYSAPAGYFDDAVCSIALAYRRLVTLPPAPPAGFVIAGTEKTSVWQQPS